MLQVVQHMGSGETLLLEVPAPRLDPGCVLIRTSVSLISAGTERMLVEFGRASLLEKARQQPDKVKMVLQKVRTDGLLATVDAVRSKLDQPLPLGYCNSGVVTALGPGVTRFKVGDRVVSNGAHAGVVNVPVNLCAAIPANVDDACAAFTVLAAIGLQGIRLAAPTLGEVVVVTGLGLIGLLTVQLLCANGCIVIGIDPAPERRARASALGANTIDPAAESDPASAALRLTRGAGVDAVLITASTKSNDPVSQAARMCRKRGRIVLVGVTGLELERAEFYEKELTFQVSCSYGPGRYDPQYEAGGIDYPIGYVRWTEQRNFEAVLELMAAGKVSPASLITKRYPIERALDAYADLTTEPGSLGILLDYPSGVDEKVTARKVTLATSATDRVYSGTPAVVVGFIGAGNYGSRILIPAFRKAGAVLDTVVTSAGPSGVHHGRKTGFTSASTDIGDVINRSVINTVAIVTRHNSHADLVCTALRAGKHVFVEKPLALTIEELDRVRAAYEAERAGKCPLLMVGFNRRFSPLIVALRSKLQAVRGPKAFIYTCNAGKIPAEHWTRDRQVGGGRLVGEACHFIDLLRYLAESPIASATALRIDTRSNDKGSADDAVISLRFTDGSLGTIHYLTNGGRAFPKERLEVFADDAVLQLDNYVSLKGFGWPGFSSRRVWRQDKGQDACAAAFVSAIRSGAPSPISPSELFEIARISIEIETACADA